MSLACGLQLPSSQKSLMICWHNFKLFNFVKKYYLQNEKKKVQWAWVATTNTKMQLCLWNAVVDDDDFLH